MINKPHKPSVSGAILVGGKSRRFGTDKALLRIGDKWMVYALADELKKLFGNVFLISDWSDKFDFFNDPVIKDVVPDKGPLGGLYTALLNTSSEYVFLCACDLLLLNKDIISHMLQRLNGQDVLIPIHDGKIEPTAAFYSRDCLSHAAKSLNAGSLNIRSFFDRINVEFINFEGVFSYDTIEDCFSNINTKADWENAWDKLSVLR
jgi:molybdopterin-guanine dinucleotide biosynthesis protein A